MVYRVDYEYGFALGNRTAARGELAILFASQSSGRPELFDPLA